MFLICTSIFFKLVSRQRKLSHSHVRISLSKKKQVLFCWTKVDFSEVLLPTCTYLTNQTACCGRHIQNIQLCGSQFFLKLCLYDKGQHVERNNIQASVWWWCVYQTSTVYGKCLCLNLQLGDPSPVRLWMNQMHTVHSWNCLQIM